MIAIGNVLISDDIIGEYFACQLSACRGACCVQGEQGAPLAADELPLLAQYYDAIKPYLTEQGINALEAQGLYLSSLPDDSARIDYHTPLINGGACAYVVFDEQGTATCGIQQAYNEGKIAWQKPLSCHLYPIRIQQYEGFEAVNYDRWRICKPACKWGKSQKVRIYQFLREPLIRKYGQDFYDELCAAAEHLDQQNQ